MLCQDTQNTIGWHVGNRTLFLIVLEFGKSKINVPRIQCLVSIASSFIGCLLTVSSYDGRGEGSLWVTNSQSWVFHPHDLITSPKHHHQIPSHWELVFNMWMREGAQTFSLLWVRSCIYVNNSSSLSLLGASPWQPNRSPPCTGASGPGRGWFDPATGDQASFVVSLPSLFSVSFFFFVFAALWFISFHLSLPALFFCLFPFLPNLFVIGQFPNHAL